MKNNILEYIILYVMLACVALALATLARISAASMGFDSFTTFMIFIVTLGIQVIVYLSIHVVLQSLMLPWIEKLLMKIPYFKNKIKVNSILIVEKEEIDKNQIRNEHLLSESQKRGNAITIANQYTQTAFAPYLSDSDIIRLCSYIDLYVESKDFKNVLPIKVDNQLSTTDVFHFGWNIWNHFQVSDQMQMARFLKTVFSHTLREVEVETIKKKLKIFEPKCIIQVRENLSE